MNPIEVVRRTVDRLAVFRAALTAAEEELRASATRDATVPETPPAVPEEA